MACLSSSLFLVVDPVSQMKTGQGLSSCGVHTSSDFFLVSFYFSFLSMSNMMKTFRIVILRRKSDGVIRKHSLAALCDLVVEYGCLRRNVSSNNLLSEVGMNILVQPWCQTCQPRQLISVIVEV